MSVPEIVREAEYLLPPPADRPSAAPGRKKLYVHVPARRRAGPSGGGGEPVMNRLGRRPGPGSLTGLRALVTGGSSGIGAATARALACRGGRVAVGGRDLSALERVAADTGAVCVP